MPNNSKVFSYIGFAKRAGKLSLGFVAVESEKKGVELLLLCGSTSENSVKVARKIQNRLHCPMLVCKEERLEDYVCKPECKIAAVKDKNLAKAIMDFVDSGFIYMREDN